MQDFYRCAPRERERADANANMACRKLVKDMHYEARVQAVIDYWVDNGIKYDKEVARNMFLTRDQYIEVKSDLVLDLV